MTSEDPETRYSWLAAEIAQGSTIVTGSRRLARDLLLANANDRIAEGLAAWPTPQILSWPDWLSRIVSSCSDPTQLSRRIDPLSVTVLWERYLGRRIPDDVLNLNGVVRQAIRAWQRLGEWNVSVPALLATAGTEDERLFASAAADYHNFLQENDWIDDALLPPVVASLLSNEPELVPRRLVLAGFDRISPSVLLVLSAAEEQGACVHHKPFTHRAQRAEVHSFQDVEAELRAAGRWAREQLEQNPTRKIAIISPDPESETEDTARLVREGFVPGWQFGGVTHRAAVNVSFGRRLPEYPAIAIALLLLRWTCRNLLGSEVSILLRSTNLGAPEMGGRSRLERKLRAFPDREWEPDALAAALSGADGSPDALAFLDLVKTVGGVRKVTSDDRRSPTKWILLADQFLENVGWPGARALESHDYQLVNRWRELMNAFAKVGTIEPSMDWPETISRILGMAADTVWQPESGPGVITVLGKLEVYGLEFDRVWISGMDASQWPPRSRPLPYVSRALQRERGMPDATPADTLAFARRLLTRFRGAAPECVFSWAERRKDVELMSSTMLDGLGVTTDRGCFDPSWSARHLIGSVARAKVSDDPVPPIAPDEHVRGGSYTLQRQFIEPFSAFVHGRLGVRHLEPFSKGLSPSLRGSVIHDALHNLLIDRPTQQEIEAWPDLESRIGSAVDSALGRIGRHATWILQRLIGIEGRRLRYILHDFIAEEKDRSRFSVIDVEKELDYQCGGIALHFKIDRVDSLPDGRLLVIDYKTGAPKSFHNRDGDLTDLQLVAYADALGEPIGGLVFINVDTRVVDYRGTGDGWLQLDNSDWGTTLDRWKVELHRVVKELVSGDGRIVLHRTAQEARPLAILSRYGELTRDR